MNDSTILRPRSTIRFRVVGDEGVVVRQDSAEVIAVNDVGASILSLLGERPTLAQLLEELLLEFEVDRESLRQDVVRFLSDLVSAGVVEEVEVETP
jgi:Coenzyme PQQ synthesis protein D (PqqD)